MHQTQLMQKESTGLCALLQDDKKEGVYFSPFVTVLERKASCCVLTCSASATELKRLYKLYSHLPTHLFTCLCMYAFIYLFSSCLSLSLQVNWSYLFFANSLSIPKTLLTFF